MENNADQTAWGSGTLWHCGPGILWWTTAPSVATISWTCASTAKPIKPAPQVRNVPLLGASAMYVCPHDNRAESLANNAGCVARLPFPLHLPLAQNASSVPAGQSRLGVPKVWTVACSQRAYVHGRSAWEGRGTCMSFTRALCWLYEEDTHTGWSERLSPGEFCGLVEKGGLILSAAIGRWAVPLCVHQSFTYSKHNPHVRSADFQSLNVNSLQIPPVC